MSHGRQSGQDAGTEVVAEIQRKLEREKHDNAAIITVDLKMENSKLYS